MAHRPLPALPPDTDVTSDVVSIAHSVPEAEPVETFDEDDPALFIAQHDFEATDESMLSIKKGEFIKIIIENNKDEWSQGRNNRGKIGWVPTSYLVANQSLNRHDWYHGKISRNRAEYLLSSGINGSFLIRESESSPGQYSLSVRYEGRVYHYRINYDPDGSMYVQEGIKFTSIPELVTYHNQESGGLITCLRYAAQNLINQRYIQCHQNLINGKFLDKKLQSVRSLVVGNMVKSTKQSIGSFIELLQSKL